MSNIAKNKAFHKNVPLSFIHRFSLINIGRNKRAAANPILKYYAQSYDHGVKHKDSNQMKYGPLFSFFDYYQDFIVDLGYLTDVKGKVLKFKLTVNRYLRN
jgi:hypothetical protein